MTVAGDPDREDVKMSQAADEANARNTSDLLRLVDAQFEEVTPLRVSGTIAADDRHHQPWGLIHGGLYTAAIETFATIGAFQAVKDRGQQVVGVSNATDFIRPHRSGRLRVAGEPIHQGRTYQLWQVEIRRADDDRLVARGQVRLQHLTANS
jgi:1,4-dihydroxy-2-naphthoyl-CoA hydrolase